MQTNSSSRKYFQAFAIASLLILVGVSCSPVAPALAPGQTVIVLPQIITKEVTKIVYVPVTITPTRTPYTSDTPTLVFTPTLTPTIPPTRTPTPQPPGVSVLVNTECLFGPNPAYISMYNVLSGSTQIAIGRNQDTSWMYIFGSDHKNPCWVRTALLKVFNGAFTDAPVTLPPVLTPYTTLYPAPSAASASRVGNFVSIFWLPVPMTEADYNGYLVEAWVCQDGQLVFVSKNYITSFDKNSTMLAVSVTDEPGCSQPSSARVYAVTTNAYTTFAKVLPWPVMQPPTPTVTPTP